MKYLAIFLLIGSAMGQDNFSKIVSTDPFALPDNPQPQVESCPGPTCHHMKSTKAILKDWKFLTGTGVLIAATAFDEKATLNGLQRGVCVENNPENPHPSFGDLAQKDWPIVAGLTAFKFLLAKLNLQWWSYETIDVVGAFKHTRGGYRWVSGC